MKHSLAIRMLSMLLALVMVVGYVPSAAFATEGQQEEPAAETSLVSDAITCTVTLDAKNGSEAVTETVVAGEAMEEPETPAYEGYEFSGWYNGEELWDFTAPVTADMTLYAGWLEVVPVADTTAVYKVEHHLQTAEGYELKETDELEGIVGEDTAAEAKDYEGYVPQKFAQAAIAADGSTVVVIKYDAVKAEPVTAIYKVEHHLQTAEGYELKETDELEGIVGEDTAAEAKDYEGYVSQKFAQAAIADDGSTVVVIKYDAVKAEPATAAYKVEHHLQTAEGYELKETDELEGIVGEDTAAEAKDYEGYVPQKFAQAAIADDGSTVVVIKYDAVKAEPVTAIYKVEHHLQTAEGYALEETEELEGIIGEDTAAEAKDYEGYVPQKFAQAEIAADGSTVVVIRYDAVPAEPATVGDDTISMPGHMTVISNKKSDLAPGITLDEVVVYDKNKDRVEIYVATADLSVDTVGVYATYLNDQNDTYGMSKLTEQVAAVEAKNAEPFSVVSGINASYYNMITGKPLGAFVMKGNDVTGQKADGTWEGDDYAFFAILKDGTPIIGDKGEYSKYRGQIAEAVEGHTHLINDGQIVPGLDAKTKYPRQTVGITADGRVITMTADGNQAPKSIGLTIQEQAEVMLALGCVEAVHLDGGGSCTYGAKPEGEDTFRVISSPSDGSERSVSNSLIFVSTAAADGTFHHAIMSAEHDYVTPGSSVEISATGVDFGGGSAEIPAEGITWQVEDPTMGSVENGVFTSGGTAGDAVVQMVYGGSVVGEVTVHVVIPDKLTFNSPVITVPYGKTVPLDMTANYGVKEVVLKEGDVTFRLEEQEIGSISGFKFTAPENVTVTSSEITAVLTYDESVTATSLITLGKGSESVYNFEDGTDCGLVFDETPGTKYNYVWPETEQSVVTAANGKVHSGTYALRGEVNYGNSLESGYMKTSLYSKEARVFKNATKVGMWIYIPDECVGLWVRWTLQSVTFNEAGEPVYGSSINSNAMDTTEGGTGIVYTFEESGWHYLYADTTEYEAVGWKANSAMLQFYISDRDGAAHGYKAAEQVNIPSRFVFYMDDITVDYSSAVDDREAPVFGNVTYATSNMADAAVLDGNTVTGNVVTFAAAVAENTTLTNATGLDLSTVRAYVDGNPVAAAYSNGKISAEGIELADGLHTVKFSVCDKQGNYASVIRKINVAANTGMPTIRVVPKDASLDRILLGSVYYVDVIATDIEKVQTVTTTLDLDNGSVWNLANMDVAPGFRADYSIDEDDNIATITITRTGETETAGEQVLASLPVRTWELKTGYTYPNGTKAGQAAYTYAQFKSNLKEFWPMAVVLENDMGKVTFTDGTCTTFSGADIKVMTEMWANYGNMTSTEAGKAYYNAWNGGHIHTAEAIADKAPDCTETGYTGRTFCAVCNSPVVWGTKVAATGHVYELTDGVLKCACGKLFSGVHTDGKTYVDGVLHADGWENDTYYRDGVLLTGVQKVPAADNSGEFFYDFGEDGKSEGLYTGLAEVDGNLYYTIQGAAQTGWIFEEGNYYYFDKTTGAAVDGKATVGGYTYEFENWVLVDGAWVADTNGSMKMMWAGKWCVTEWITVKGNTYYFNHLSNAVTGPNMIKLSVGGASQLGIFDESGVFQNWVTDTGLVEYGGVRYYLDKGIGVYAGLIELEGDYYYINSQFKAVTGTYRVTKTNGLKPAAEYLFGSDGKMIVAKNGLHTDEDGQIRFYKDNVAQYAGLVQDAEGNFYYINSSLKAVRGTAYYVTKTNGLKPVAEYLFGKDGKMIIEEEPDEPEVPDVPEVKQGLVKDDDGQIRYYVDGVAQYAGLVQDAEGNFYYINSSLKAVRGTAYYVTKTNGLKPAAEYLFDRDGKMVLEDQEPEVPEVKQGLVKDDDGYFRYYVDGVAQYAGLVQDTDGSYYYVNSTLKAIRGTAYYVTKTNGLLPAGQYMFAADGKMINPPA